MKLIIALFIILIIYSCDDATAPSEPQKGDMSAEINGSAWANTNHNGVAEVSELGNITLTGTRISETDPTKSETITLYIISPKVGNDISFRGTYSLKNGLKVENWVSDQFNGEITSLTDSEIKGKFSFTAKNISNQDSKSVTKGNFFISMPEIK